jgi:hypothetical protein
MKKEGPPSWEGAEVKEGCAHPEEEKPTSPNAH